ncbi:ImmA/IrrE family metallo-endopeptidase [Rothia sp. LK2588]|uniref:ImmA/IrrE family metallo-endopeptidase n=1 Tax=Rothia sp. LK2588 TaxID=3114369 RepID=UPI0034D01EC0
MYDPDRHAIQLGLRVIEGDPGRGRRGLWVGNKTIIIRGDLTAIQRRCTIAHEIVHAEYDPPFVPQYLSAKAEARADRIAASRLIDPEDYHRACNAYEYQNQVAYELGVTTKILRAYQRNTP